VGIQPPDAGSRDVACGAVRSCRYQPGRRHQAGVAEAWIKPASRAGSRIQT
jgi:hypothetical protein